MPESQNNGTSRGSHVSVATDTDAEIEDVVSSIQSALRLCNMDQQQQQSLSCELQVSSVSF